MVLLVEEGGIAADRHERGREMYALGMNTESIRALPILSLYVLFGRGHPRP
jgi:hypothetical protein